MKRETLEKYIEELTQFAKSELEKLHDDGKVKVSNKSYYDIIGKELRSEYKDLGTYHSFSRKARWRENYKTTNSKFSPSRHLSKKVLDLQFYKKFEKKLPSSTQINIKKLIQDYNYLFFLAIVRAEDIYNKAYIKTYKDNLYDVITNKLYKNVDEYLLNGVWTKREIRIRLSDIELVIYKPNISLWLTLKERNQIEWGFNSMLEIIYYTDGPKYSYNSDFLLILLSLYNLGSVFSDYSYSYLYFDMTGERKSKFNKHYRTYYTYELHKKEEVKLKNFIEKYRARIAIILNANPTESEKQKNQLQIIYGIKVAIDRYRDGLLMDDIYSHKRISSAVMGLEALYNFKDTETIGFKLKVRVAKVLGYCKFDSKVVAKDISEAYSIRSKYAHGSISAKNIDMDFEERVFNYLRISILGFMNIDKNKDVFINELSCSLYSKKDEKILSKYIRDKFKLPYVKK